MAWCAGTGLAAAGAGAAVVAASHEISINEMLPINNQYHYEAEDIKILLHINLKNEAGLKILEPVCLFDKDRLSSEILLNRTVNVAEHIIIVCSLADYQWLGLSLQFSADNTLMTYLINTSGAPLSPEITLKLHEQLARLTGDLRIQEVRGLFREEAVNSGPCIVEYFKSLCKIGLPLEVHEINHLRKEQQALLYNNTQIKELNERALISVEIFNEFNLRQYNNSPSIKWEIFSPSAKAWDGGAINHGIELINMLLDFEFQEVINAILNIDVSLSPTQFFSQLIDHVLSDYRYVRKNENMFRLLTEDSVKGLNAEAVKNLILAKSNHTKQGQVHAFFRFYHEIFQSEPAINVVAAGTEFLMNLIESGFDCDNLIRLFAPFAYYRNRKGLTALQMALNKDDRIVAPILLAHAPLVDSDHLAECISLADHHVRAATSPEKQWSWTIFFSNRLLGIDVHQVLLETKYADPASLTLLQIYRKQLLWLQNPAAFKSDTDKKYESMDAAKYFAIKFTLLFRLLMEVEHGRVELPALPAAAGAGAAAPSMEEHRALIVKRLLVELNRELALARIVFYVINYLQYPVDCSIEHRNYFDELRNLLATSIVKNLTKLNVDNSLIIPLYWTVNEINVSCCCSNEKNSGHALYLQITSQEDSYYLYLHNYGDGNDKHLNIENRFHPRLVSKIIKAALENMSDDFWLQNLFTEGLSFKTKEELITKFYPDLTEAVRQLRAHPPQTFGNCIAYGHWRAQAAVTEGFGEDWSYWLVQKQMPIIDKLEEFIKAISSKDIVESTRLVLPTRNKFNPNHAANILRPFVFPDPTTLRIGVPTIASPPIATTFAVNVVSAAEAESCCNIN